MVSTLAPNPHDTNNVSLEKILRLVNLLNGGPVSNPDYFPEGSTPLRGDTINVSLQKICGALYALSGGGGPTPPTGPAGGDLDGTYPDPRVIQFFGDSTSTLMWVGDVLYMRDVNIPVGGDCWHTVFLDSSETPGYPQFVIGDAAYSYSFLTSGL